MRLFYGRDGGKFSPATFEIVAKVASAEWPKSYQLARIKTQLHQ